MAASAEWMIESRGSRRPQRSVVGGMGEVQSGEGYDAAVFVEPVVVLSCGFSGVGSSNHHHHQHSLWVVERGCRRRASCQQPSAVSASGKWACYSVRDGE